MQNLTGRTLDTFYFQSRLGSGGMADVYRVWDREREVQLAVKVLKPELAGNEDLVRLFKTEMKILSGLQHPNIVRFYGASQKQGIFYFVMDYVEGTTLKTEMDLRGALPVNRMLEVMVPVCTALGYSHHRAVIHCDIKPANVLIHKNGSIYLSDFGISRLVSASVDPANFAGTPHYMAPEQVKGYVPSPETDIFALGVILYEMTAGVKPFTGSKAPISGSLVDRLHWEKLHLDPDPIIPKNEAISRELEDLIFTCLEKDPWRRPHSVVDFLPDLQQAGIRIIEGNKQIKGARTCRDCSRKIPADRVECPHCVAEKGKRESNTDGEKNPIDAQRRRKRILAWVLIGLILLVPLLIIFSGGGDFEDNSGVSYTETQPAEPFIPPQKTAFLYISPGGHISGQINISLCNWDESDTALNVTVTRPDGSQNAWVDPGLYRYVDCGDNKYQGYQIFIKPDPGEEPGDWRIEVSGNRSGMTASEEFLVLP